MSAYAPTEEGRGQSSKPHPGVYVSASAAGVQVRFREQGDDERIPKEWLVEIEGDRIGGNEVDFEDLHSPFGPPKELEPDTEPDPEADTDKVPVMGAQPSFYSSGSQHLEPEDGDGGIMGFQPSFKMLTSLSMSLFGAPFSQVGKECCPESSFRMVSDESLRNEISRSRAATLDVIPTGSTEKGRRTRGRSNIVDLLDKPEE